MMTGRLRCVASWGLLAAFLLTLPFSAGQEEELEYAPYDGWYNNRAQPSWGGSETQVIRRMDPVYSDGVYEPSGMNRPNPLVISDRLMNGTSGLPSSKGRTALLVFYGQQLVEEIMDVQRAGCPPEFFNIDIPSNHSYNPDGRTDRQFPFLRTRYDQRTGLSPNNPRQQLNEISSYIDGTLMYGPNKAWADALRTYEDGLLSATNDSDSSEGYYPAYNVNPRLPFANPPTPREHELKLIDRFFRIGNVRGNENPALLTFGIMWFRYHNLKARQFKVAHPSWSDEKLFNEARKWTIATHQKISMYDWLPAWLAPGFQLEPYEDGTYDPTVHPGISQAFQTAAMRFGHTLVPPGILRRKNGTCEFRMTTMATGNAGHRGVRLCNAYWNSQEAVTETDIDELLLGMASQIAEKEDNIITPDLRTNVFGPLEFSQRDLMALNIQRARDHGLPDYNTARKAFGLPPITRFADINNDRTAIDQQVLDAMDQVYNGRLNDIDIWVGGLMETTGDGPGPLFEAIIKDQFTRLRNGDRFWYENYKMNGLFTQAEFDEINATTLRDVIISVTAIDASDIQADPFILTSGDPCYGVQQLSADNRSDLAACPALQGFDYFSGSSASYILSFAALGLVLILAFVLLFLTAKLKQREIEKLRSHGLRQRSTHNKFHNLIPAVEWQGKQAGDRNVFIKFDEQKKMIVLFDEKMSALRTLDLRAPIEHGFQMEIRLGVDRYNRLMALHIRNEYDMVLKFNDMLGRDKFMKRLKDFFDKINVKTNKTPIQMTPKLIYKTAFTKKHRQELLEKFFRVVFAHALEDDADGTRRVSKRQARETMDKLNIREHRDILKCELTRTEFAEALSLKPKSLFVENMYKVVDKNNDGYVSFREFLDVIVIFAKGSADRKARMLFNMYDIEGRGRLTRDDFRTMLRSMVELAAEELDDAKIDEAVSTIFQKGGFENKSEITFADFQTILHDQQDVLSYASLDFEATGHKPNRNNRTVRVRRTIYGAYTSEHDERRGHAGGRGRHGLDGMAGTSPRTLEEESEVRTQKAPETASMLWMNAFNSYFENNRRQIFWTILYTLVCIGIFVERAYYFSVEREHAGLRRIAGYGVTVTRGAASGMMFTFACLLVTMCRNLITFLRETFLNRYIPFDDYIHMHKFIAWIALFFTVMHIIGHGLNFYHIATQRADDLTCLFRDFFHRTHVLPKFHYWLWDTLTGFTGVLLTIVMIFMYVFASSYSRQHTFKAFWITHHLYIPFFILMVLHGAGRLVQPPFTHFFILGPVVLFIIDRLVSVSRKKVEISVIRTEKLPSDVTYLEFQRPQNFEYKSGQWVKIASLQQSTSEYHPFTLTSAPHEENLSLHIRAVGPWTTNLRNIFTVAREVQYPKIYLDGPYGEGHQDWYKYEVAVLVGGGIGVTPFASILKDIAYRSQQKMKLTCKKVYFMWVTRTQRQFEWMTDIIRQVEEADHNDVVSVHIFVTQFKEKFDIRTTMLYICERHFHKISNRSLFTGLRSITHFGRPDFISFFQLLLERHADNKVFGVFSCGPPPMTSKVEDACSQVNRRATDGAIFEHHYENF